MARFLGSGGGEARTIAKHIAEIEKPKAEARKREGKNQHSEAGTNFVPPTEDAGKTADKAAEATGYSRENLRKVANRSGIRAMQHVANVTTIGVAAR